MNTSDQAFNPSMVRGLGRGLAQDVSGEDTGALGGAASTTSDQGNSLFSTATGGTSSLLGADGSDPTYSGDSLGSGGTSGGGSVGSAASSSGTSPSSLSSALSSLTSGGNLPLIIGAVAVVGGIAGVAYLAHRKQTGGGGRSRSRSSHGSSRAYARRRR